MHGGDDDCISSVKWGCISSVAVRACVRDDDDRYVWLQRLIYKI
jgi:hypothetical protein